MGSESKPAFHTAIYTPSELLKQPWLPNLFRMINDSYSVSHTDKIKYTGTVKRLETDSQFFDELGEDAFTVVAFASKGPDQPVEMIGTASVKKWKDDGLWRPCDDDDDDDGDYNEHETNSADHSEATCCPGDYELAVVALPPDPRYRGKGIAAHLVKMCDDEIIRRERIHGGAWSSPVRVMIRTTKENTGAYWLKQGFSAVGSRKCPKGFWGAAEEFTLWAMSKELSPESA